MTKPHAKIISEYFASLGKRGGRSHSSKGVAKNLTLEQRRERARMMANARWHRGEVVTNTTAAAPSGAGAKEGTNEGA